MKVLELVPLNYIGLEMYNQWQSCLIEDDLRRKEHEARKRSRQDRKERKLIKYRQDLELHQSERKLSIENTGSNIDIDNNDIPNEKQSNSTKDDFQGGINPSSASSSLGFHRSQSTGNLKSLSPKSRGGTMGTRKLWNRFLQIKPHMSQHTEIQPSNLGDSKRLGSSSKHDELKKSISSPGISDMVNNYTNVSDEYSPRRNSNLSRSLPPKPLPKDEVLEYHSASSALANDEWGWVQSSDN